MQPRDPDALVEAALDVLTRWPGPGPESTAAGRLAELLRPRLLAAGVTTTTLERLGLHDAAAREEIARVLRGLLIGDARLREEVGRALDQLYRALGGPTATGPPPFDPVTGEIFRPVPPRSPPPPRPSPASPPSPPASARPDWWSYGTPSYGAPQSPMPADRGRGGWLPSLPTRSWRGPAAQWSRLRKYPVGPLLRRSRRAPSRRSEHRARRLVSTGIAHGSTGRTLSPRTVLQAERPYRYWFAVDRTPRRGRVDEGAGQHLPPFVAAQGTRLRVILFPFADGLRLDPAAVEGELVVTADGGLRAIRQPGTSRDEPADRLEFPFRTPEEPGRYRLRSSVYLGARLLQSRVLEVRVGARQRSGVRRVARSETDYTLSETLAPASLAAMRPPRLSVMVNDGPGGTHDFRFVGIAPADGSPRTPLIGTATLDAEALESVLTNARRALRTAAWGKADEWQKSDLDRYAGPRQPADVEADLIAMARTGYRIWFALKDALADVVAGQDPETGGAGRVDRLVALLLHSGTVELTARRSLRLAVPSALIYDYPLDSNRPTLRFCPDAAEAMRSGADLTTEACFDGGCPSYGSLDVVCPGGFWGYRHELGVPLSLGVGRDGRAHEMAVHIPGGDAPEFVVGSTTDGAFCGRAAHLENLRSLHVPMTWRLGEDRDAVLDLLKGSSPHVVYFLCHGVEKDGLPGLVVGDPDHPSAITPDNLGAYRISWPATRPLVVLNGCRTTALDPTKPLNFVETFLKDACASGVIGTEITVFEPLACAFAEEVLGRFVRDDMPLGAAVRATRLALLARGNPLGLAYVPYAPTELHMA